MRALVVFFQSKIPGADTCDSLNVTNLALDVFLTAMHGPAAYGSTSFEAIFDASHLFSNMPLYGNMVVISNCYGDMNTIYYFIANENQTLSQKIILQKI